MYANQNPLTKQMYHYVVSDDHYATVVVVDFDDIVRDVVALMMKINVVATL